MKVTRKQLKEIINRALNEDRFDDYSVGSPDEGNIAYLKALASSMAGKSSFINIDLDHLFSVSGGTSTSEIKNLNPYVLDVLRLVGLDLLAETKGENDAVERVRRTLILTSSFRDESNQVTQLKTKLDDAKKRMSDQEAIEAVARLYSPEDGDPHMTQETHKTALAALEMINVGDISGATSLVGSKPISMHQSYNSVDLRSTEGRKDKIMKSLDDLVRRGYLKDGAVFYNYESSSENPMHSGPEHVHLSVGEEDPLTSAGRDYIESAISTLNSFKGFGQPQSYSISRDDVYDYYDGAYP